MRGARVFKQARDLGGRWRIAFMDEKGITGEGFGDMATETKGTEPKRLLDGDTLRKMIASGKSVPSKASLK